MSKVYENKDFIILGGSDKRSSAYILYNKNKEFSVGHTHLNNYNTALWIMKLYTKKRIPLDLKSVYLLQSLMRISNDEKYSSKIQKLIDTRASKPNNHYINVQKGVKSKQRRKTAC